MLNLKHALLFAAAISNMQFLSMEGGLTHIQGFLRLSDNVGMFYPNNKSDPSIDPHRFPLVPQQTWML